MTRRTPRYARNEEGGNKLTHQASGPPKSWETRQTRASSMAMAGVWRGKPVDVTEGGGPCEWEKEGRRLEARARVRRTAADLEVASQECNDQEMPSQGDLHMQRSISLAHKRCLAPPVPLTLPVGVLASAIFFAGDLASGHRTAPYCHSPLIVANMMIRRRLAND